MIVSGRSAEIAMRIFDRVPSENLDHREMHLILLACTAIIVLAAGLALFMYPIVISETALTSGRTMSETCTSSTRRSRTRAARWNPRSRFCQRLARRQLRSCRCLSRPAPGVAVADRHPNLAAGLPGRRRTIHAYSDRWPMRTAGGHAGLHARPVVDAGRHAGLRPVVSAAL